MPIIMKFIPTKNKLNSKTQIKEKYTRSNNTSLTFFQRLNKQHPFFSKLYLMYNQQQKQFEPLTGHTYYFFTKTKIIIMISIKIHNNCICLALNSDQFTLFLE